MTLELLVIPLPAVTLQLHGNLLLIHHLWVVLEVWGYVVVGVWIVLRQMLCVRWAVQRHRFDPSFCPRLLASTRLRRRQGCRTDSQSLNLLHLGYGFYHC